MIFRNLFSGLEMFPIRSTETVRLIPSQEHLEHQKEACQEDNQKVSALKENVYTVWEDVEDMKSTVNSWKSLEKMPLSWENN